VTPFALIVGSGFERLGFEVLARSPTKTPYGEPSSAVLTLNVSGARVPCAPHAVTAPLTTPSAGGSSVNGRPKST